MRLRRLEPVLRRALRGPCRLPRGSVLLVAVSGGADSTALLVALASLAREFDLTLRAAHLHHGLRGRDADADRTHVRELCERLHVPLTATRWDCAARMRTRGLTGEAGLRTLRREFLLQVARRSRAAAIVTAHTADDQLETLLLRLARGTGLTGAGGMLPRHGAWLKPMLQATRADIERDLARHGIAWREDASNASQVYARNRVRHAVIPALLDAIGTPAASPRQSAAERRAGLARRSTALAGELATAAGVLARAAARALDRALIEPPEGPALRLDALERLSPMVLRLALRRAWRLLGPSGEDAPGLTSRHLEPLLRSVSKRSSRSETALPEGWRTITSAGRMLFARPGAPSGTSPQVHRRAGAADARMQGRQVRARGSRPSGSARPAGPDGRHPTTARR